MIEIRLRTLPARPGSEASLVLHESLVLCLWTTQPRLNRATVGSSAITALFSELTTQLLLSSTQMIWSTWLDRDAQAISCGLWVRCSLERKSVQLCQALICTI